MRRSATQRRRSRRSASKAVIPSTVEPAPDNNPYKPPLDQTDNAFSFFGGTLARPALVGNPDQSVQKLLKDNTARMHFVSSVQPLMGESFSKLHACSAEHPGSLSHVIEIMIRNWQHASHVA